MSEEDDKELPLDILVNDDPELRERIGRHLGAIRKQREISQEEAAKGIGFSRPHLSNIELGRARTGWTGLQAMAKYYHLDIEGLIAVCKDAAFQKTAYNLVAPIAEPPVVSATQGGARNNNNETPENFAATPLEAWLIRSLRLLPKQDRQEIRQQIIERVLRKMRQTD